VSCLVRRGDDSADASFSCPCWGRICEDLPSRLGIRKLDLKERGDRLGVGSLLESFLCVLERSRCVGFDGLCKGVMLSPPLRTVSAPVGEVFAVVLSGMSRSVMSVPREGGGCSGS
jgi:hypothetical protein